MDVSAVATRRFTARRNVLSLSSFTETAREVQVPPTRKAAQRVTVLLLHPRMKCDHMSQRSKACRFDDISMKCSGKVWLQEHHHPNTVCRMIEAGVDRDDSGARVVLTEMQHSSIATYNNHDYSSFDPDGCGQVRSQSSHACTTVEPTCQRHFRPWTHLTGSNLVTSHGSSNHMAAALLPPSRVWAPFRMSSFGHTDRFCQVRPADVTLRRPSMSPHQASR